MDDYLEELFDEIAITRKKNQKHFRSVVRKNVITKIVKSTIIDSFAKQAKIACSKIDFGCDFHGCKCIENRKRKNKATEGGENYQGKTFGCCSDCKKYIGHWENIPESILPHLADAWNDKTGFLGHNGCRLEPQYRSKTCVSFACRSIKPLKVSKAEDELIHLVREIPE